MSAVENRFIPLSVPNMEGNEKKYIIDAIDSTFVSTVGSYTRKMEESLASFLGVSNVAVCQSGTAALHLAMVESKIGFGDIVLVPPVTFIAAVNPVRYCYATPVFIDCDDSLCMDPVKLNSFCEQECKWHNGVLTHRGGVVKAVVVVHIFGNMADMESIMTIARKYKLIVIEDATEALGTKYTKGIYKGKFAGTIGDIGCFSFNGNKIITTGGGGAITSSNASVVQHMKYLSTQAKDDAHYYIHNEIGYNYRMTNLQAALGVAQMEKLPEFIKRKRLNYDLYQKFFKDYPYAVLLGFREGTYSNKWFYSLFLNKEKPNQTLHEIISLLESKGIGTRAIWGLINKQRPYCDEETYQLDKATYYADRILNIPCSTNLTKDDIVRVVDCVKEVLNNVYS